jgi:hypothetical protein
MNKELLVSRVVRDWDEVLRLQPQLIALSARTGPEAAADYLAYFAGSPENRSKRPCLVVLCESGLAAVSGPAVELPIVAAVLFYEYQIAGQGIGVFATWDYAGRRAVIAPREHMAAVVAAASSHLLRQGASLVLATCPSTTSHKFISRSSSDRWAHRTRQVSGYLPIAATAEETFDSMGRQTRRNLRACVRRAEKELQAAYVPDALSAITFAELVRLNLDGTHPVSFDDMRDRYTRLKQASGGFLAGVRRADGEWISVIGGRRYGRTMDIDWQVNNASYGKWSIGTLMRSYLIADCAEIGIQRLFFQGGTSHSMSHSFVEEKVVDYIMFRETPLMLLLSHLPLHRFIKSNLILEVLADPTVLDQLRHPQATLGGASSSSLVSENLLKRFLHAPTPESLK